MYLYHYWIEPNFLSSEECDQAVKFYKKNIRKFDDLGTAYKKVNSFQCNTNDSDIYLPKFNSLTRTINERIYGFDINKYPNGVNLNMYSEENNNYDWHIDSTDFGELTDLKLTFIINVSESEYEGGDFLLSPGKPFVAKEFRKKGTAIIFPSFLPHKVSPVTKGERISISAWFEGPRFV